ncbi:hypothetical protein RhiirC2_794627 [Rhizophagus irregularis]|uniref:MULE transposase domain-containing protein n=1 Tax=Rhizophagus irregularis TaxID=588596 RepID=A0A2N1MD89_9GLOM|nr:hypothetical protein RhiirC2_794627 [Rhizophagus irregularis]
MSVPSSQSTVPSASSPLIITSASNLTPDEKQNLLFDVDRALEIPMEVFNKKWWPLKRPKAIRSLVEIEAAKNYSASTITSAVKKYATLELGLGEPVRELKRKEVANIKYKVRGLAETYLIGNLNLKLDISDSISYLTEQGGIVFAHPKQLKKLEYHGWLTLIDSTHKTNRSEDADTVAEALIIICNKYCHWSPRYILSDLSNIEAKSIKKTFPGMAAGEQECQVILCIVHVMRTWMQKIHEKKSRDIMIVAMHKRTKIGCESLIQDAINSYPVPSIQSYIKRNYTKNTKKWGLWARQHSPLLLQVTSTNSLESFHSELKKITSSSHGLISAAHKVVNVDCKKKSEAESASFDFRIKKISAEACAVMNRLEKEKNTPESGFEVYESRESFIEYVQTEQQKNAENRRIAVGELTERIRDRYWRVEEMGDVEKTQSFISMLEASVNLIILQFNNNSSGKT